MAIIPTLQAQGPSTAANEVVTEDPRLASAANDRRGQAFDHLEAFANSLEDARRKAQDDAYVRDNLMDAEINYADGLMKMKQARAQNPEGTGRAFVEQIDADLTRRLESAPSRAAADALKNRAAQLRTHYGVDALTFENNQWVSNQITGLKRTVEDGAGLAGNYTDVKEFETLKGRIEEDINNASSYMPPAQQEIMRSEYSEKIGATFLEANIIRDPQRSLSLITEMESKGYINGLQAAKGVEQAMRRIEQDRRLGLANLDSDIRDYSAMVQTTGKRNMVFESQLQDMMTPQQYMQFDAQLNFATDTVALKQQLQVSPTSDIVTRLQDMRKELGDGSAENFQLRAKQFQVAQETAVAVLKEREENPVGAAKAAFPNARNPKDIIAAQVNLGIPEYKRGILETDQAKQITEDFLAEKDPTKLLGKLDGLSSQVGDRFKGYAMNDLGKQKLPAGYLITAAIPRENASVRFASAKAAIQGEKQVKEAINDTDTWKALQDGVTRSLRDYNDSYVGSGGGLEQVNQLRDHLVSTAGLLTLDGKSNSDAVDAAGQLITGEFNFFTNNSRTIRVPKKMDTGLALDANKIEDELAGVNKEVFDQPTIKFVNPGRGITDNVFKEIIKENAYWATTLDDQGVTLMLEGAPVLIDNGGRAVPIEIPFDGLQNNTGNQLLKLTLDAQRAQLLKTSPASATDNAPAPLPKGKGKKISANEAVINIFDPPMN